MVFWESFDVFQCRKLLFIISVGCKHNQYAEVATKSVLWENLSLGDGAVLASLFNKVAGLHVVFLWILRKF